MSDGLPAVDETARAVVAHLLARRPTLGRTRLLCVDGPAGSGKSTLAAAVRRVALDTLPSAGPTSRAELVDLVHMDDVYPGWSGLTDALAVVARDVVAPLRSGRPGRFRRWDWDRSSHAEERVVRPVDLLVVEGVGSGNAAYAADISTLVWVEAPHDVRLARGVARDGEELRAQWLAWAAQEEDMFTAHRTRERADLVVDGMTGAITDPPDRTP